MISLTVNIDAEDNRWSAAIKNIAAIAVQVKDEVCHRVEKEVDFLSLPKTFFVNLCLSNDEEVHRLNREFRNMDKPTNVLSFAALDGDDFDDILENETEICLGDIIIAYDTMVKEADTEGISLHDHFCHLWAHGLLHILGYDHITDEEAVEMEQRETEILGRLDIADPYRE